MTVEGVLKEWRDAVYDPIDVLNNNYVKDIHVKSYKYRWKWFRPPMWKIFMWAYKCTRHVVLKDAYPARMN